MKDRGETSFSKLPKFAAKMYNKMMQLTPLKHQRNQIAKDLLDHIDEGRLLDIGTGHGMLLLEIHKINPNIELYGYDISEQMINIAKDNLKDINVNLEQGNIKDTTFKNDFFDMVTCTGSFYLWNNPIDSINEIHRILKPGRSCLFFESDKDYNKKELKEGLKSNLQNESFFNRKIVPYFLKKQLKMTYPIEKLREIIGKSLFNTHYSINKISLANLPIWLKIELKKN
ncbi:MAG: class I SAM-dependent methyltransferase [Promethearchaeota archaeon]